MKKIITIILLFPIVFGLVGCGRMEEKLSTNAISQDAGNSEEYNFDKIELNKDNIFAFGIEKTARIEIIVKKYGITTTHKIVGKEAEEADMTFLDDEKGIFTGDMGHTCGTQKSIKVNDGGENLYDITFIATKYTKGKDESILGSLLIVINDFKSQDFKFENYKMFKEMIQACFSKEFDINALEKKLNEFILATPSGEKNVINEKVGEFNQTFAFENNKEAEYASGKVVKNRLTFLIALSK